MDSSKEHNLSTAGFGTLQNQNFKDLHARLEQKLCVPTVNEYATPENLGKKLKLHKKTRLPDFFRKDGM